jgi:3-hydroxyisobutyrate dehydrogenase-like beta-hydroxyacid dehydrogenase
MSDISVIGLGAMGSALASALLDAGFSVTVWNRSQQRAGAHISRGAKGAVSVSEALQSSPVIMICVDNYKVTNALLETDGVIPALSERSIIQFSTGTPKEARDSEAWLANHGAHYLDGAIMCYPNSIGAPDSKILIGGKERAFKRAKPFLQVLGGDLRYLGENIASAATLDLALLSTSVALYLGVAHSAHICESEGVGVDLLASVAKHGKRPRELAEIVHLNAFELSSLHGGASLAVWASVLQRLQAQARDAGIDSELPDFLASIYQRGVDAGYGEEDVAALIKVLRTGKCDQTRA